MTRLAACIMAGFLLLGIVGEVSGGTTTTSITIQATVPPVLGSGILCNGPDCPESSSGDWVITAEDLTAGHKEISPGTVISVTTDDPDGYILQVCSVMDPSTEGGAYIRKYIDLTITGTGLGIIKLPHPGCVEIHMPYPGPETVILELNYDFQLRQSADPGTYLWPISVTVLPF